MPHTTDTRRTLRLGFAAMLGGLAAMLAVTEASAQECASNADCAAGFQCVKGVSAPGCATPPDCPDPTPVEDATGWCEQMPVTCQTDADCPAYLKCVANQSQTCWADSEGNSGCDPIDPNAPKTCEYVPISCTSSADCPANFDCIDIPTPCPAVDCQPGTDCPQPECPATSEKMCTPQQITCQGNADCPTAWLCADVGPDCATSPPSTGGGTEPVPAPAPGTKPQDTSTNDCADAAPILLCIPPGFASASDTQGAGETAAPAADPNAASGTTAADEGTGCSMSSHRAPGSTWLAALSAAALASVVARRLRRR